MSENLRALQETGGMGQKQGNGLRIHRELRR